MGGTEGVASIEALVAWLRALKEKVGKGVVGNIDARALGRVSDALKAQQAKIDELERALKLTSGVARKAVAELETG